MVSLGELPGPSAALPTDVAALERMLFRPVASPASSASLIEWLSPDAGIVTLQPRRLVEDQLLPWVFGAGEPVMPLVTGPGGQGKTVLGRLVCRAAAKEGWSAGFADLPAADWRMMAQDGAVVHQVGGLRRWTQLIAALTALPALERDGGPARCTPPGPARPQVGPTVVSSPERRATVVCQGRSFRSGRQCAAVRSGVPSATKRKHGEAHQDGDLEGDQ